MGIIGQAKIKTRLLAGFGAILGLLVVLTAVGVSRVGHISVNLTEINDLNSVKQRYAINFRGSVHDRAIALRDVVLVTEPAELSAAIAEIRRLEAFYADSAAKLDAMLATVATTAEERAILASIKETEARTLPMIKQGIAARSGGRSDEAKAILLNEARPAFVEWLARINQFIDLQERNNQAVAKETRAIADEFTSLMLVLTAAALLIGVAFGWWTVHSILPLRRLTDAMLRLADGDLEAELPPRNAGDEVGEITGAVEVFKRNAQEAAELRRTQTAAAEAARRERQAATLALAKSFEDQVQGVVETVTASATQLRGAAEALSGTAQETERQSTTVAASSDQASASVDTVLSAAGELTSSIQEIARRIEDSSVKAREAAEQAHSTNMIVDGLSEKADRIGDVLKLISDIASQTNLLALNATIEAARAGEAGKGFAVVASEVKTLASQTGRATGDISERITEIQAATQEAVQAIRGIATTINEVNQIAATIAAAVEQQSAATSEITRSVGDAASATQVVSASIRDVRKAAAQTGNASADLLTSSAGLSQQADLLRTQVNRFLADVRSA